MPSEIIVEASSKILGISNSPLGRHGFAKKAMPSMINATFEDT